jgi:hypothetical protein
MGKNIENSKEHRGHFTLIVEEPIKWDKEAYEVPEIETMNLGRNITEVRDCLSDIDFTQPGIHILNLQPGIGKTHAIKEFLKNRKAF